MGFKGRKHSERTKILMSIVHKGKKLSGEWRKNISKGLTGLKIKYPRSQEYRNKMSRIMKKKCWMIGNHGCPAPKSAWKRGCPAPKTAFKKGMVPWNKGLSGFRKGIKFTIEHRKKIGDSHRGEKNYRWRGGSFTNIHYSSDWGYTLKEQIRNRDGHKCKLCGVPEIECARKLDVHHIDFNKKDSCPTNLISLCRSCHVKIINRELSMKIFSDKGNLYAQ